MYYFDNALYLYIEDYFSAERWTNFMLDGFINDSFILGNVILHTKIWDNEFRKY